MPDENGPPLDHLTAVVDRLPRGPLPARQMVNRSGGRPEAEAEAVALANDTRYGLNAMLFTRDPSRAHRVAAGLRAGTLWVNCFFIRDLRAPFGGAGESGVGREGGNVTASSSPNPKPW
jgi:hypothetical protein